MEVPDGVAVGMNTRAVHIHALFTGDIFDVTRPHSQLHACRAATWSCAAEAHMPWHLD